MVLCGNNFRRALKRKHSVLLRTAKFFFVEAERNGTAVTVIGRAPVPKIAAVQKVEEDSVSMMVEAIALHL